MQTSPLHTHFIKLHQTVGLFSNYLSKILLKLDLICPMARSQDFRHLTLNSHGEPPTEKLHYVECDSHRQSAHPGGRGGSEGPVGVLLTQLSGGWSLTPREELGNGAPGTTLSVRI